MINNCDIENATSLLNGTAPAAGDVDALVWYCARTKPKQEHIAAANVRKTLQLEVFLPRIEFQRSTFRGLVRTIEPVFPSYIFVQMPFGARFDDLRFTAGISDLVHFGQEIPTVSEDTIAELKQCFATNDPVRVEDQIAPGSEVQVGAGAFANLTGVVLRSLPARRRVQILLEILGRPTMVEVDRTSVLREKCSLATLLPSLAA